MVLKTLLLSQTSLCNCSPFSPQWPEGSFQTTPFQGPVVLPEFILLPLTHNSTEERSHGVNQSYLSGFFLIFPTGSKFPEESEQLRLAHSCLPRTYPTAMDLTHSRPFSNTSTG